MEALNHNSVFMMAIGYVLKGQYAEALSLYDEPGALPSDKRVIEKRIEQHISKMPIGATSESI